MERVEIFHLYGLDVENRIIYMGSEQAGVDGDQESGVDCKMVERFIKNLCILESESEEEPILIILNNVGGDPYMALAIYDAIKSSPCEITIHVYGVVMSSASIIFQAADWRVMSQNSVQMIHYGTISLESKHSKTAIKELEEETRVNRLMENIYLDRINEKGEGFILEELQELLDHDTYLTAQRSVDLGLCDEVI